MRPNARHNTQLYKTKFATNTKLVNGVFMKSLFHYTLRTILIVISLFAACITTYAQSAKIQFTGIEHLAPKASETVDVNIDERLIQITAKFLSDPDDADVKKIVANLKGIYVKNYEFEADGLYSAADVETIRSQVRGPSWSRLLNVQSKKEGAIEVYILLEGEKVGGLVVLSVEPRELTVVNIVGPVDLEKLASLEGNFGIPDLDLGTTKPTKKNEQ
jgi:hypothetical protein